MRNSTWKMWVSIHPLNPKASEKPAALRCLPCGRRWASLNIKMERKTRQGNWNRSREVNGRKELLFVVPT
jgi:hypothetical protein